MTVGRSLLVVEDDPVTGRTFRDILASEGYGVELAADAESGLAAVAARPPAGILLDLRLPLADGVEFLRRLRAVPAYADIRVALVTGDYLIDEALANAVKGYGAEIYFKPLWLEDLLRVAARLLAAPQPAGC